MNLWLLVQKEVEDETPYCFIEKKKKNHLAKAENPRVTSVWLGRRAIRYARKSLSHRVLTLPDQKETLFSPTTLFHLRRNLFIKKAPIKNKNKRALHLLSAPLKSLSGAFLHALLDAQHQVNEPVDLDHPALFPADLDLVQQVVLCFILAAAHGQRLADVLNVLLAGQLRHACSVAGRKHWEWVAWDDNNWSWINKFSAQWTKRTGWGEKSKSQLDKRELCPDSGSASKCAYFVFEGFFSSTDKFGASIDV